jgi:hypothetical protein
MPRLWTLVHISRYDSDILAPIDIHFDIPVTHLRATGATKSLHKTIIVLQPEMLHCCRLDISTSCGTYQLFRHIFSPTLQH